MSTFNPFENSERVVSQDGCESVGAALVEFSGGWLCLSRGETVLRAAEELTGGLSREHGKREVGEGRDGFAGQCDDIGRGRGVADTRRAGDGSWNAADETGDGGAGDCEVAEWSEVVQHGTEKTDAGPVAGDGDTRLEWLVESDGQDRGTDCERGVDRDGRIRRLQES